MQVSAEITQFISTELLKDPSKTLGPDESLLQGGVLDSLRLLRLISHLEKQYGITVDDDELQPETFETIATITRFVESKRGGAGR